MSAAVVRVAGPEDVEAVLELQGQVAGAPRWTREMWREILRAGSGRGAFVAEAEGGVVGFVVVGFAAGVAEMETVAVRQELRGAGLGRWLCGAGMQWAREAGAERIELEVRASNFGALRLYRRLGFVEQGRRAGYYRDPVEDGVLMVCGLVETGKNSEV